MLLVLALGVVLSQAAPSSGASLITSVSAPNTVSAVHVRRVKANAPGGYACHSETALGSIIPKRVCVLANDNGQSKRDAEDTVRDMQAYNPLIVEHR